MARKLKAALANYQQQAKRQQDQERKKKNAIDQNFKHKAAHKAKSQPKAWIPFAMGLHDYSDEAFVLVGEGDFSFAASVADQYPSLPLVATSLDSRAALDDKYPGEEAAGSTGGAARPGAAANLAHLAQLGVPVAHEVDATALAAHLERDAVFEDTRVGMAGFLFPHIGNSVADQDRNIRQHQELLLKFFEQCAAAKIPKVVLALFEGEPYQSWQAKSLARSAGYRAERSARFPWEVFPGYAHQLTSKGGAHTSKQQSQRAARLYLFVAADAPPAKKRKNADADADADENDD